MFDSLINGTRSEDLSKIIDQVQTPILEKTDEIPIPQKMELVDLEDLINLISSTFNENPSIYHCEIENFHVYFIYVVIHDYYHYRGIPLLIYAKSDLAPSLYLKYQISREPNIKMTNKFEDANAFYIKIVRVKKLPDCMDISI
ncbi:MAG: hypothetical protein ACTSPQ_13590 [Candidatus Helarchaeota archaeon]